MENATRTIKQSQKCANRKAIFQVIFFEEIAVREFCEDEVV